MGYYVKHTQTLSPPPPPSSLILSGMRRHCHTIANTFLVDFEHRKITNCSSYPPNKVNFFFLSSVSSAIPPTHPTSKHTQISVCPKISRETHTFAFVRPSYTSDTPSELLTFHMPILKDKKT